MQIKTISVHKYHEYLDTVHEKEFLQSDYQGVKFSQRGWEVEYIEAIKDGKTVAFSMIACMPLMKVFKYCYIPRGFFMDYHSKEDVISFTSSLKEYLKKKNVIYAEIDPCIEFVQRDKDGNIVGKPLMGGIDDQSNYDQLMKQIQSVIDADSTNK